MTMLTTTAVARRHLVQFYADPDELIARAAAFLAEGARAGEGLAVLCLAQHRAPLSRRLAQAGVPEGQVVWADAEETATALTRDGRLEERPFEQLVGPLLRRAAASGNGRVRAFGEVVTVLCRRGQPDAALRLEAAWETHVQRGVVDLLCGYPFDAVGSPDAFASVCAAHHAIETSQGCVPGSTGGSGGLEAAARGGGGGRSETPHTPGNGSTRAGTTAATNGDGPGTNKAGTTRAGAGPHPAPAHDPGPDVLRIDGDPRGEELAREARLAWQAQALAAELTLRRQAQAQLIARERELEARAAHQESVLRLGAAGLGNDRIDDLMALAVQEVERQTSASVLAWCARTSGTDPADATIDCTLCLPVRTGATLRGLLGLHDPQPPLTAEQYRYLTAVGQVLAAAAQRADAYATLEAQRASLERMVDERTRHLLEANRELEAFNSSVSHDLRNHVRVVSGYAGLLAERHGDGLDPRGLALVARLEHQAGRMAEVIDDLLALARATRLEPALESIDVSAVADEVAAHVAAFHPHAVEWTVEPSLRGRADPALLRIVLENLLGNAWKFTRGTPAPQVAFGAAPTPHGVAFYVRDNGVGFPAAAAPRLFQPFFRLHGDDFPGNGMGLATVGRIVSRHGGKAWAEGAEGKGATIWFTLAGAMDRG